MKRDTSNGFSVTYTKAGNNISVFAPNDKAAKEIMVHCLNDDDCSNIGVDIIV